MMFLRFGTLSLSHFPFPAAGALLITVQPNLRLSDSPADWPMSEFESMHPDPPTSRVVFFGDSDIAVSAT